MSKLPLSSLRIDVTLSLICPQTPVTLSTTQKMDTATTATIIIATETTKASRVTDHGSTCTSRRLARRPGWGDGDAGRWGRALGALDRFFGASPSTAGMTAVVARDPEVVRRSDVDGGAAFRAASIGSTRCGLPFGGPPALEA